MGVSSCETFVKRFHRVSFSKEGFTDCPVIFLEAWQLRDLWSVVSRPVSILLRVLTGFFIPGLVI
jgi:hypothetical protein